MTKQEYAQLKAYLMGAYQNLQITDIVWYDMLKEYDFKLMQKAVKNIIKQSSYPPTIANLVKEYEAVKKEKIKLDTTYVLSVLQTAEENKLITTQEYNELEIGWNYDELTNSQKKKIIELSGNDNYMKEIMGGLDEKKLLA